MNYVLLRFLILSFMCLPILVLYLASFPDGRHNTSLFSAVKQQISQLRDKQSTILSQYLSYLIDTHSHFPLSVLWHQLFVFMTDTTSHYPVSTDFMKQLAKTSPRSSFCWFILEFLDSVGTQRQQLVPSWKMCSSPLASLWLKTFYRFSCRCCTGK